jgi:hypothetical protein
MPYRIPFGSTFIECDTPEEAMRLALAGDTEKGEFLPEVPLGSWTDVLLDTFLHRLGADQKKILSILVSQHRATADELRTVLGVSSNQALAGVISGISKQAAALGISARDVFGIENRRRAGVLSKAFFAADAFLKIARETGWPSPEK